VPAGWLPNINSAIVIFGSPILGILFKKIYKGDGCTALNKFIIGLLYLAFAMLFVISGILISKFNTVSLIWLVLTYIFLSFSELFIAPVGFATVGKYVYRNNQSLMTGAWISILGLGGLVASKMSNFIKISQPNILISNKQYLILFVVLFTITIISICLFYIFKSVYLPKLEEKY
jgi:POT family proton-dependent oligopeptide transporter